MSPKKHKALSERANRISEQTFPLDPYVWGPLVWMGIPFLCIGLFLLLWYALLLTTARFQPLGHSSFPI